MKSMSSIYDNIEFPILPELQHYLKAAYRADFCVGYFNISSQAPHLVKGEGLGKWWQGGCNNP